MAVTYDNSANVTVDQSKDMEENKDGRPSEAQFSGYGGSGFSTGMASFGTTSSATANADAIEGLGETASTAESVLSYTFEVTGPSGTSAPVNFNFDGLLGLKPAFDQDDFEEGGLNLIVRSGDGTGPARTDSVIIIYVNGHLGYSYSYGNANKAGSISDHSTYTFAANYIYQITLDAYAMARIKYSTEDGVTDIPGSEGIATAVLSGSISLDPASGQDYNLILNPGVACFASGTLISTERGNVAVEHLNLEDRLITRSGASRPIVWIGCRELTGSELDSLNQQPIRVRHGAFGKNTPRRDLYLSPGHPVLVGSDADGKMGS